MSVSLVVFANTGPTVGLGHLVRCAALVGELQQRNVAVELWMPPSEAAEEFLNTYDLVPTLCQHEELPERIRYAEPEMVVLDSYALSAADIGQLSTLSSTVVIDELGDRRLPVDTVINNNVYADTINYPDADTVLAGPSYCMLRPEFRDQSTQHPDDSQQEELAVLLTIGGADLKNSFESILETTARVVPDEATLHAIVGPYFDDSSRHNVEFHRTPSHLATLMARCDFAVSGGGQTLYELAVCGTPPVAVRLGNDQVRNITRFAAEGFCIDAGWPDDNEFSSHLRDGLTKLIQPDRRSRMADIGRSLVDGNGVTRVADILLERLSD